MRPHAASEASRPSPWPRQSWSVRASRQRITQAAAALERAGQPPAQPPAMQQLVRSSLPPAAGTAPPLLCTCSATSGLSVHSRIFLAQYMRLQDAGGGAMEVQQGGAAPATRSCHPQSQRSSSSIRSYRSGLPLPGPHMKPCIFPLCTSSSWAAFHSSSCVLPSSSCCLQRAADRRTPASARSACCQHVPTAHASSH